MLHADRFFSPIPAVRDIARELYQLAAAYPLVCPHGHVDPRLLALDEPFPDPATLIVIPDHYIVRMLYSQGVPMEALGIPRVDGGPTETDPRRIWQIFGDHFHLFRGTPSGAWLSQEFEGVFGIDEPLTASSAMRIYDHIDACLARPDFRPRALFERFRIEVLVHDRCGDRLARVAPAHPAVGLDRRRAAHVPARPGNQPAASELARGDRTPGRTDRARHLVLRPLHPGPRATAPILQADGRQRHRPRGRDAVHRRAVGCRGRGRVPAGPGRPRHSRGRAAVHRAHADRDGQDERRRRPGDAVAPGLGPQSQPAGLRALRARSWVRHPAGDRIHAQPETAAQQIRQRPAADPRALHARRDHLLARAGAAGRPLPCLAAGPARGGSTTASRA